MTRTPLPSPLMLPGRGRLPVLLSVPHAGIDYPQWLLKETRRGRASLEPLEDPLVDRLIWRARTLGIGAVIAQTPRAAIDCNRGPHEIDSTVVSVPPGRDPGLRARSGLGLIPGRTPADGELWRRKVDPAELALRRAEAWDPYHRAIAEQLAELNRRHAEVLLLDCHSMPPRPGIAALVIGDRHGRTSGPFVGDLARTTAEEAGFPTAFNEPYAGGHVIEAHGRPARGIHALQLELDRSRYLDDGLRRPGPGFDQCAQLIARIASAIGERLLDRGALPQAAE